MGTNSHLLDFKLSPRTNTRSDETIRDVITHYRGLLKTLPPENSIELNVCFDGRCISPSSLGAYSHECVAIESEDNEGNVALDIVPVERISFRISITNKKSEQAPREIRFKANR